MNKIVLKKVIEIIQREQELWKIAYPEQSNLINKIILKILFEIRNLK